jgi:tetratricopeptide (TPR) repeat protein
VWRTKLAGALFQLDRLDEAQKLYAAAARDMPEMPLGLSGLARVAMRRRDWEDAGSLWTRCLEKYAENAIPEWRMSRAAAWRNLGRADEAVALLAELTQQYPERREFEAEFIRASIEASHNDGSLREKRESLRGRVEARFGAGADETAIAEGMQLLAALGYDEEAAAQLPVCIERAVSLSVIEKCFYAIPLHVERGSRGGLWEKLLAKLRNRDEAAIDQPRAIALELCVLLALERFVEYEQLFDAHDGLLLSTPKRHYLEPTRRRLGKPRSEVFAEEKIFGIGLSKTGTTSLTEALTILGIDAGHWANPLTGQLITDIDTFLLGASTDTSVAYDFEKLYYLYPNARFIWTRRPFASWKQAFTAHYNRTMGNGEIEALRDLYGRRHVDQMFPSAAVQFGLYLNAENLNDAFQTHSRRVRRFFADKPEGKLLEFDIFKGQGWAELCAFLGLPSPERPFPWANKSASP